MTHDTHWRVGNKVPHTQEDARLIVDSVNAKLAAEEDEREKAAETDHGQ